MNDSLGERVGAEETGLEDIEKEREGESKEEGRQREE